MKVLVTGAKGLSGGILYPNCAIFKVAKQKITLCPETS